MKLVPVMKVSTSLLADCRHRPMELFLSASINWKVSSSPLFRKFLNEKWLLTCRHVIDLRVNGAYRIESDRLLLSTRGASNPPVCTSYANLNFKAGAATSHMRSLSLFIAFRDDSFCLFARATAENSFLTPCKGCRRGWNARFPNFKSFRGNFCCTLLSRNASDNRIGMCARGWSGREVRESWVRVEW